MQIFLLSIFDECTGSASTLLCALPGITTILEDPQSCPLWLCPRLSQSLRRSLPIHTRHFVLARQYQIVSTTRRKFRPFLDFPCSRNAPLEKKLFHVYSIPDLNHVVHRHIAQPFPQIHDHHRLPPFLQGIVVFLDDLEKREIYLANSSHASSNIIHCHASLPDHSYNAIVHVLTPPHKNRVFYGIKRRNSLHKKHPRH